MPVRSLSLAGKRVLFSMMLQTMPALRGTSVIKAWAGDVPVAWITPPSANPDRLLYFLHGGGYTMGSIRSHIPLVSRLAAACGSRALLVDYRLAPEHPYPAAIFFFLYIRADRLRRRRKCFLLLCLLLQSVFLSIGEERPGIFHVNVRFCKKLV